VIETQDRPVLLRVDEAARLLAVSRSHIYELINRGDVPVVRLGGSVRVPRVAIDRLAHDVAAMELLEEQASADEATAVS